MPQQIFKAGTYKQQYQYKSFSPALVNGSYQWNDPKIDVLLEEAVPVSYTHLDVYKRQVKALSFLERQKLKHKPVLST